MSGLHSDPDHLQSCVWPRSKAYTYPCRWHRKGQVRHEARGSQSSTRVIQSSDSREYAGRCAVLTEDVTRFHLVAVAGAHVLVEHAHDAFRHLFAQPRGDHVRPLTRKSTLLGHYTNTNPDLVAHVQSGTKDRQLMPHGSLTNGPRRCRDSHHPAV
jgi:hypothetical protein